MATTHRLDVPGAHLHYEIRGDGPVLLALGSPMDAAPFAPLAEKLAHTYTVVTHDPRGISNSRLDDPAQDSTPQLRADDAAAILDNLGVESADMLGSSGGAVTGLALAELHPGRLRTLVAHEPLLLTPLPDAEAKLAEADENVRVFHDKGVGAAWMQFMVNAGFEMDEAPPEQHEPTERDLANGARFFEHELLGTVRYEPDLRALRRGPTRIVVGIGEESGKLVTYQTSTALAERLEVEPTAFPGGHAGFTEHPKEFAKALKKALEASD